MATTDLVEPPQSDSAGDGWYRFAPGIRGEVLLPGSPGSRATCGELCSSTFLCSIVAAAGGYALWFEWGEADGLKTPMWITAGLPLVWLPALLVPRTYETRFCGWASRHTGG